MATTSRGERYLPVARLPSVRYAGQLARRGSVLAEDVTELLLYDVVAIGRGVRCVIGTRISSVCSCGTSTRS